VGRIDHEQPAARRGRVSLADVPGEVAWYGPLLRPVIFATSAMVTMWLYPCWRTARVRWSPPFDDLIAQVKGSGRPIVYYAWHAYEPVALLGFRDVPEILRPIGIGHDGLASRMLQRTGARLGYHLWIYRRRSLVRPRDQIVELMRTRGCNIGLFTDAGGPYGRVKPGLVHIAAATNALVVPLVARGKPLLRVRRPWRHGVPLPYCRVVVHHGPPLDGARTTLDQYQRALDELERRTAASG
jgi:lysophospholipid acyltransferase (LPLAT)-like uncharacterized protein